MIEGISNSGKTKFLERLMKIFPSVEYVQQHGSRFAADYKDGAKYNHTRHHPSFVIVDEGAYSDIMDHGDIADAKLFFEGKGRALQMKNVTTKGYQWVGVPIILTANEPHRYF